jgi:hypothetical protein
MLRAVQREENTEKVERDPLLTMVAVSQIENRWPHKTASSSQAPSPPMVNLFIAWKPCCPALEGSRINEGRKHI